MLELCKWFMRPLVQWSGTWYKILKTTWRLELFIYEASYHSQQSASEADERKVLGRHIQAQFAGVAIHTSCIWREAGHAEILQGVQIRGMDQFMCKQAWEREEQHQARWLSWTWLSIAELILCKDWTTVEFLQRVNELQLICNYLVSKDQVRSILLSAKAKILIMLQPRLMRMTLHWLSQLVLLPIWSYAMQ